MKHFRVTADQSQQRLDVFVASQLPSISRSMIAKLIEQGSVTINDAIVKAKQKVRAGDKIIVDFDEASLQHVPVVDLPIIYEDQNCLVINKPAGLLTHSKGAFNPETTVATFIQPKMSGLSGERGGIVHRLDRGTSGVIICAKNPEAQAWLQKQFSQRKTKKTYIALVSGHLEPKEAIVDIPIGRHPKRPQIFRADPSGKSAKTAYKVLISIDDSDLVELKPETGRTHQLRVHMSHLGHPIIGDTFYGGPVSDRLYLHAVSLELTLPSKERKTFEAPLPPEFKKLS